MSRPAIEVESVRIRRPLPDPGTDFLPTERRALGMGRYVAVCLCTAFIVSGVWLFGSNVPIGRVVYLLLLFALATAPVYFTRTDETRLLTFFMLWYGAIFGIGDVVAILFGPTESTLNFLTQYRTQAAILSAADQVVLGGGLMFIAGYFSIIKTMPGEPRFLASEWAFPVILWGALLIWIPTTFLSSAYFLAMKPGDTPTHVLSIPLNIISNIRILPMIATVMLIYLAMRGYQTRRVWTLLFAMMAFELVLGFIGNTKEISFRIPAMLVMGSYFVRGRLEKKWIAIIIICFIPYHFAFGIYRQQYLQVRSNTAMDAIQEISEVGIF